LREQLSGKKGGAAQQIARNTERRNRFKAKNRMRDFDLDQKEKESPRVAVAYELEEAFAQPASRRPGRSRN
jgi:hypothetical protein